MPYTKGSYTAEQGFKVRHDASKTDGTIISSTGVFGVSPKATTVSKTSNATLTASDFGQNINNTGATGTITLTLPAASTTRYKFLRIQLTAAQAVRLLPVSGEKIYLGGSGVTGKYLDIAGVIGNYAVIYSDGTDYLVLDYSGVLTKEA